MFFLRRLPVWLWYNGWGRWAAARTLEIYTPEVGAALLATRLEATGRDRIRVLSEAAPEILVQLAGSLRSASARCPGLAGHHRV